MSTSKPIFVFSTPPTPNGDLHLGHLSGPYLGADAFVRFQRMNGAEAWHLTGSDDYQSYVVDRARRDGRSPAETAAHYSAEIAETLALMDIRPDQYTVTNTADAYREGLQAFFSRLAASGKVDPAANEALFDAVTGEYLYEVDVSGGCPTCRAPAGGNICEECGEPNFCADLVDPRSGRSDTPPRQGSQLRYSLPLHEFADAVAEHHARGRVPVRLKELAERLFRRERMDVPITHPSAWGVPPVETGVNGQVIWVWPEMSYGFLYGIQSLGARLGRNGWHADAPSPDWKIVHFFGYDNSFYHAILYPVLYRLAHPEWSPDIDYHVNEFYLLEGEKFSTSRRHAIWGKDILGPDTVDAVRFFLSRSRPEGRRTNFSREAYETALRDDLVGTWQHWLNDLGARVDKLYGGLAPAPGTWTPEHHAFRARLGERLTGVTGGLSPDGFSLNRAAGELHRLVEDARRFAREEGSIAGSTRWADQTRTAIALELAAANLLAHCAAPVMPRFSERLAASLGIAAPTEWPQQIPLLPPETRLDLARQTFFGAEAPKVGAQAAGADAPLLPWLRDLLRTTLQLPEQAALDDRPLNELGLESLQTVALQYQILEELGVDISGEELMSAADVTALAALLDDRAEAMRI
ncbi:class I tRNA ligase family protein [Actinomadura rudentiformis]|uniref:Class I tRNA ligase family protein n=1 Tax=Actinomadura rudentiformis TaxID=359158 RepID=A0A6H9Y8U8_9ACTN|nr:class I tRNA ligase family protein [Actinomadura rudentiformis]KAB2339681.1 class I tRNA ligase family protein [Actinomadura rudentiformis]